VRECIIGGHQQIKKKGPLIFIHKKKSIFVVSQALFF